MNAHNLRDHLREVDARLQGLSLDEQIVGELVQLPHNLRRRGRGERGRDHARGYSPERWHFNVNSAAKEHWLQMKEEITNGTEACLCALRGNLKRWHWSWHSKLRRHGKAERGLNRKVLINSGFLPKGPHQTIPGCPLAHKALEDLRCERDRDKAEPLSVNPQWETGGWNCCSRKIMPSHWGVLWHLSLQTY